MILGDFGTEEFAQACSDLDFARCNFCREYHTRAVRRAEESRGQPPRNNGRGESEIEQGDILHHSFGYFGRGEPRRVDLDHVSFGISRQAAGGRKTETNRARERVKRSPRASIEVNLPRKVALTKQHYKSPVCTRKGRSHDAALDFRVDLHRAVQIENNRQ